jgi:hypothetical protein
MQVTAEGREVDGLFLSILVEDLLWRVVKGFSCIGLFYFSSINGHGERRLSLDRVEVHERELRSISRSRPLKRKGVSD